MQAFIGIIISLFILYLLNAIKVLREYERGVIFRLGRVLARPKGPGLIFVFPPIDRMVRVSLRIVVMDIPPQDVITKDNVSVKVNAVVYFRVMDPQKAVIEVQDYLSGSGNFRIDLVGKFSDDCTSFTTRFNVAI